MRSGPVKKNHPVCVFRLNDYIDEHLAKFLRKRPNLASAVQESGWKNIMVIRLSWWDREKKKQRMHF